MNPRKQRPHCQGPFPLPSKRLAFLGLGFGLVFEILVPGSLSGDGSIRSVKEEGFISRMRHEMVRTQIEARGIKDERVLEAVRKVPRHEFVPTTEKLLAYSDGPLPIGYGQTISQPYIVALMSELLHLEPTDQVFELGTGSGYQAAVLAEIAKEVYTIEIVEPLYEQAKDRLKKMNYLNVHVRLGDGTQGWPEAAPFDKMIVTAAGVKIPETLIQQLKDGGRIVMPVGEKDQVLVVGEKRGGSLKTFETIPVRFVPLVENKLKGPHQEQEEGKDGKKEEG